MNNHKQEIFRYIFGQPTAYIRALIHVKADSEA